MLKKAISLLLMAALVISGVSFPAAVFAAETADTVYINGNIYTVDDDFSVASAIAVKGDKILYVGKDETARGYASSSTKTVDLQGKTVIPGLIESHMHFQRLGVRAEEIDIFNKPKAEILAKIKAEADRLEDGEWITSGGWNNELWSEGFPTKEELDAVAPKNPVALMRGDNHSYWCNSLALSLSGIDEKTPNPQGGEILKKADGSLWGILTDTAMDAVKGKIPAIVSPERTLNRYQKASEQVLSYGITTLVDAGVSYDDVNILKDAYAKDKIKVRAYEMLFDDAVDKYIEAGNKPVKDLYNGKLSFNAVKVRSDGSLGSRSAWLLEEYSDRAEHYGNGRWTDEELYAIIKKVGGYGFQIGTHAIGDAAVRQVMEQSIKVIDELKLKDHRFRIEHFQIVDPADIPKAIKAGFIASMQSVHATSDMNMAEDRIGPERILTAYAWRTVVENGGIIANGSDAPVELVNPYHGLYAAVTRQDSAGQPPEGWYPKQRLTKEEALKSFTIWGAYASFAEDTKGSLEAGKYADFAVIDRDYMKVPVRDIYDINVLKTYVGGELVYEAKTVPAPTPAPGGSGATSGSPSGKGATGTAAAATAPSTASETPAGTIDNTSSSNISSNGASNDQSGFSDAALISSWAAAYFDRLIFSGIISGYADGTLKPQGHITRAEFTKMVVLGLKIPAVGGITKSFREDVHMGDWYKEFVDIASAHNIANGVSDTAFAPNTPISRQDLATIAYRALVYKKLNLPAADGSKFADDDKIADYAKEAVYGLKALGVLSGRPDGYFDPAALATREETAKIVGSIIQQLGI